MTRTRRYFQRKPGIFGRRNAIWLPNPVLSFQTLGPVIDVGPKANCYDCDPKPMPDIAGRGSSIRSGSESVGNEMVVKLETGNLTINRDRKQLLSFHLTRRSSNGQPGVDLIPSWAPGQALILSRRSGGRDLPTSGCLANNRASCIASQWQPGRIRLEMRCKLPAPGNYRVNPSVAGKGPILHILTVKATRRTDQSIPRLAGCWDPKSWA